MVHCPRAAHHCILQMVRQIRDQDSILARWVGHLEDILNRELVTSGDANPQLPQSLIIEELKNSPDSH